MVFNEDLSQLSEKIISVKGNILNEEDTKMSMIVLFQVLDRFLII